MNIEKVLEEKGYLMTAPFGTSMLPFIRPQRDIIVVRKYQGEAKCRDVILYRRVGGKLVLHRILEVGADSYVLCGDNQYIKEYGVKKEQVLGVLEGVYRDEKYIDCKKGRGYKVYVRLWCKSLFMRRIILKVAISACSMVKPIGDSAKKWDAIVGNVTDLCGSAPQLIDELYKSESDTNFNNRSIAWLLKNYNRIYDDPDMSLDLYTRQCSLGVTALQLSIAAGTIANGGVNPVTKKEVFDAVLAPKITAMIAAVGFYEHTGDWMYTSGIPAKTGVGGGVMGVLPGQFGIAAFAPPLDGSGNSVKAQLAIQYIMNKLELNVFSNNHITVVD